jgi:hypothetical protein
MKQCPEGLACPPLYRRQRRRCCHRRGSTIEKTSVRRQMDIGGMGRGSQSDGRDRLLDGQIAGRTANEGYRRGQFVRHIDKAVVLMLSDVAQPAASRLMNRHDRRQCAVASQSVLCNQVKAEIGNQHAAALRHVGDHMRMLALLTIGFRTQFPFKPQRTGRRRHSTVFRGSGIRRPICQDRPFPSRNLPPARSAGLRLPCCKQ